MAVKIVPQKPEPIEARARRFDMRALWRLTCWGAAAALALAVVAIASQTESGSQRLAVILASADIPVWPVSTVEIPQRIEPNPEVARLEAQVRTLAADRDRLAERLASLERNLDDMTGSIKRQTAQATPATTPPPAKTPPPEISPPATAAATDTAAPQSAPQTTTAADQPAPAAPEQAAAISMPNAAAAPARVAVPMPPVRVAAAPAIEPPRPEFGVALASSSNVEVLRLQWAAMKANFGPMLTGLRPIASREPRASGAHYRLVLGPLPNYAAATKLCARLTAAHATCHAGKFAGEPL